jgi:ABC-type lipoprotein release transport system permease subunit
MRFLFNVAWRNLWRHSRRTLITAAAMGVGVAMCMAAIALTDGMYVQMFDVMVTDSLGHVQVHHPDYPAKRRQHDTIDQGNELVEAADAIEGVHGVTPRLFTFALVGSEDESTGAQMLGVSPEREANLTGIDDKLEQGTWLTPDGTLQAVLGVDLARDLNLGVGDELIVVGQDAYGGMASDLYQITGIARTGMTALDRGGVWVRLTDLQAMLSLEGKVHEILIVGADHEDADDLSASVSALPSAKDALVRTWSEASPQTAQMMGLQDVSAFIMLGIVLSVASLGVLNTMLMSVFERMREFGVLRALGMNPGRLMSLVVLESLLLASVAIAMGLVMGGALDAYLVHYGLDFSVAEGKGLTYAGVTLDPVIKGAIRPFGIVVTVVAVFAVTLVAAIWPGLRAARLEPVEAMREN